MCPKEHFTLFALWTHCIRPSSATDGAATHCCVDVCTTATLFELISTAARMMYICNTERASVGKTRVSINRGQALRTPYYRVDEKDEHRRITASHEDVSLSTNSLTSATPSRIDVDMYVLSTDSKSPPLSYMYKAHTRPYAGRGPSKGPIERARRDIDILALL